MRRAPAPRASADLPARRETNGPGYWTRREPRLPFDTALESDSAVLHALVSALLDVTRDFHVLRGPTRGGLASSLNEIAGAAGVGIEIDERKLPVRPQVIVGRVTA